jgi:hypothetical protein
VLNKILFQKSPFLKKSILSWHFILQKIKNTRKPIFTSQESQIVTTQGSQIFIIFSGLFCICSCSLETLAVGNRSPVSSPHVT